MKRRSGFTLTEMLIVVGIIVLIVTLSVAAWGPIMGNRSIDAAQNQLGAIIGRARQEAIGLQDFRGVIIFQDANTDRACAAEVYFPTTGVLDLAPSHDEMLLSPGISFRMMEINGAYTPLNVIMFNSRGEFCTQPWKILPNPVAPLTVTSPAGTALALRIPNPSFASNLQQNGMVLPAATGTSAFGFVVFPDEAAYQKSFSGNVLPADPNHYITDNGITFLVNKYTGALMRSE